MRGGGAGGWEARPSLGGPTPAAAQRHFLQASFCLEGGGIRVEGQGGISPSSESTGAPFILSGSLLASGASRGQQECV